MGFTLTELVVVIATVAILTVFATARLTRGSFDTRAMYDQLLAQVSYARKTAIAQRRAVCVHLGGAISVLRYDDNIPGTCSAASTGVASPVGAAPFSLDASGSGATFAPATVFLFDGLGRYRTSMGADPGASLLVSVSGDSTLRFCVDRETGYAYPVATSCP